MRTDISLHGNKVDLVSFTSELWHEFNKNYIPDPMMDLTPYDYDYNRAEKAFHEKTSTATRLYFAIVHAGETVGQIYLKNMDTVNKTTEFGIALVNDFVKGFGYGAEAIRLLVGYAFNTLGFETMTAMAVLRNIRSQHVLQKAGFRYVREDGDFRYYVLEK